MSGPDLTMVVDAVDGSNRPIGQVVRRDVFAIKANFRTVHVLLLNAGGDSLLLQKLPPDHPRSPSRLGSSVAGYLYAGESYRNAALRKLKEELGFEQSLKFFRPGQIQMQDEGVTKFVYVYILTLKSPLILDEARAKDHEFFALKTIDDMLVLEPNRFTKTFIRVYQKFDQILKRSDRGQRERET